MPTKVAVPNYKPSSKQYKFHASEAYETFFGGAAGPGKTAAICAEAVTTALEQPNTKVYIFRRTVPELRNSILPEIQKQCSAYLKHMPYNSEQRRFQFSNGSFIQLAYLDNPGDMYKYQSAEIHLLIFDELTHFSQDEYEYIKTRVRSVEDRLLRVMCASNPGGIGHGWVKSYFIDVSPPGKMYTDPDTNQTRLFLPALIDDHPIASFRDKYRLTLQAIPDPDLRKALLEGDWNIFSGQVFTEWRRNKHVIPYMDFKLENCRVYAALDWGYNDPTSIHWIAVTPKNAYGVEHFIVYRERYENGHDPVWWAKEIANIIKYEPVQAFVMPHDTYAHAGGGKPIEQQFREVFQAKRVKVPIIRSQTQSHSAKMGRSALTHSLLSDSPDGRPYLQILDNCFHLIRTLPMLVYDQNKVEEIDSRSEDHAFDSLTYGLYYITNGGTTLIKPKLPGEVGSSSMAVNGNIDYVFDMEKALRQTVDSGATREWKYR